ncbi:MAG: endonuclease MutS2 [Thermodesulfobacteriota bacterium]|nr:endonuclease MutS2 [Thermodesulfobacteriota bacterium]
MLQATLQVLEFNKLVSLISLFTVTPPGKELALALQPLQHRDQVSASLQRIAEAQMLLEDKGSPPLGGSCDLGQILERVRIVGAWLSAPALLEVASSLDAVRLCRGYFGSHEMAPALNAEVATLQLCAELRELIRHSIGPAGDVLDGASWRLADLRSQSKVLRGRIRAALESMLTDSRFNGVFQDQIITERNGRYVLPVRVDYRGRVKGFVHDESSSGQTLFIEPAAVLERNNTLQSMLREEQREIERILLQLAAQVGENREALRSNQHILSRLDYFAAAARFARLTDAQVPQLTSKRQLELLSVRHPLLLLGSDGSLREQETTAIDLRLGKKHDTLIISGPNTGGKTVALKTVGLLFLMVSAGLPIPCDPRSRVYLFSNIFADIGDEQSIEENLSTFSGHLVRIRRILKHVDGNSLVLLDEAGTGTDPAEGGALALAVMDRLRAVGARTVVTTHLNMIKSYAYLHERVENAAVEFDPKTFAPTYRLHYGVPGASSAFTIARRMGIPSKVLAQADSYLGREERDGLEMVEQLNRLRTQLEGDLREAQVLRERAEKEREKRRKLLSEFEDQRELLMNKSRRRAEQMVSETQSQVRQLLKQTRQQTVGDGRQQAELMRQLRETKEQLHVQPLQERRRSQVPQQLSVGELVQVVALNAQATVKRVSGTDVELTVKGKLMRVSISALEAYHPRRFAQVAKGTAGARNHIERPSFNPRLEVVGMRVEEALPLVERLIDDALLHNWKDISVVHGRGTGALRQAIRDLLAVHRGVTAFHAADNAHGGDAVTVIELG